MVRSKILLGVFTFLALSLAHSQGSKIDSVVNGFIKNMGGVELWRETSFLYLKEKMWYKQADIVEMEIWLDLERPKSKIRLKNKQLDRVRAFTVERGWGKLEDGVLYEFDSLRLQRELANWKRNIYTICRKIALNREQLVFKLTETLVLEVYEGEDHQLCAIELNKNLMPIKWSMVSDFGNEVSICGPLVTFGKYNFPKWRTSLDGHWQFEYQEVKGYSNAPPTAFLPEEN